MAEGEGFEPPVPQRGTTVFKTVAFVRSATPPPSNVFHRAEQVKAMAAVQTTVTS